MPLPLNSRYRLLARTFVHLEGIGPRTERHLWRIGIKSWEHLRQEAGQIFRSRRLELVQRSLDASEEAWSHGDLVYFHHALPGDERWRLLEGGLDDIAYFDIEASGGGMPPAAHSTAIAFLFRGEILQAYEERDKRLLIERMIAEAAIFCTYNGASYDIPFLAREFALDLSKAHIDLCPWLRRLGFKGGLKAIQKALPHLPQRSSMDIDGYDAVRLWRLHEEGRSGALDTLLAYNAEDVLILSPLLQHAYQLEADLRPYLALEALPSDLLPEPRTAVDPAIYAYLKGRVPGPGLIASFADEGL